MDLRWGLLCVALFAFGARAEEVVSAPADAVSAPSVAASEPAPAAGWARLSAGLGIAGAAVPLGFAAGYTGLMYSGARRPSFMLLGAGVASPLIALIPTFGGRSATVSDDLAHKPRLFRILGWIMVGLSTFSLVTAPAYEALFDAIGWGGPSAYSAVSGFLEAALAASGIIFISIGALISADRAEGKVQEAAATTRSDSSSLRVLPTVSLLPGPRGASPLAGLCGTF